MKPMTHDAIYGSVVIRRGYCSKCKGYAFILDGKLACCDIPFNLPSGGFKQMSEPAVGRDKPSPKIAKQIINWQGNRCFFCHRRFGAVVYRHGKQRHLRITWDHWIPFCYSKNNRPSNFVAACQICNGMKSSKIFNSQEEAETYVFEAWEREGYKDSMPEMRSTIYPETPLAKVL